MDNIQFGAFVAQLRKEQNLTQKELADRLHVTDKAVSKWETGKGFPDVKLLEPLAQELEVSLVELLQGARSEKESLTIGEAGEVLSQAISQSQRVTTRRYLRLLGWILLAAAICLLYLPVTMAGIWLFMKLAAPAVSGVIGSADTYTMIVTTPTPWLPVCFWPILRFGAGVVCLVLAIRVWKLKRSLV